MASDSKQVATLEIWVIYFDPSDFPGRYVVRKQYATADGVEAGDWCTTHATLQAARESMPAGLHPLGRFKQDAPAIVEVWI